MRALKQRNSLKKKAVKLEIDEETHALLIQALGLNWRGIQSTNFREIVTAKLLYQSYRKTNKLLIGRSHEFPYSVSIDAFHASVLTHALMNNVFTDMWQQSTSNWIVEKIKDIV